MSRLVERLARAEARLKEIEDRDNIRIIVPLGADDTPIVIDLRSPENSTLPEWAKQYWPKTTSTVKPAKSSKPSKPSKVPRSSSRRSLDVSRQKTRRGKETNR